MHCTNCGTSVESGAAFCPNCGTRFAPGVEEAAFSRTEAYNSALAGSSTASVDSVYPQPEEKVKRVIGYLIDVVPMLFLSLLHFLPVVGWMLYGLLHVCYWLFRDINGASLGKLAMGGFVASADGTPAGTQQRILRNVPLALPGILGMIPLLGLFLELGVAVCIFGGEAVLLLATGRRFGDRLAGTMVFRR